MANEEVNFDSAAAWLIVFSICVGWFVLLPVDAFYLYKYYQNREDGYIRNRRYQSAMGCAALNMALILIQRPLYMAYVFFPDSILGNEFVRISISNFAQVGGIFYVLRMWLLYYDYQRKKHLLAHKWRSQLHIELKRSVSLSMRDINSNENVSMDNIISDNNINNSNNINEIDDSELHWTIKYQKFFNNNALLHGLAIILWICIVVANLLSYAWLNETMFNIVQNSYLTMFILIAVIGYYKIHKCHDELDLRSEFSLSIISGIVYIVIYAAIVVSLDTFSWQRALLSSTLLSTLCGVSAWILTGFIYIKLKNNRQRNAATAAAVSSNGENKRNLARWVYEPLTFQEIISKKDGFELFTNHLVMEYSIENMLFVLEIEIIKDEMIYYNQVSAASVSNRVPIHPKMKKIKRSETLKCNNYYRCIQNFQFLIVNYVRNDAPYCINVSSVTRRKILKKLAWMEKYLVNNQHEEFINIVRKKSFNPVRLMSIRSSSSSHDFGLHSNGPSDSNGPRDSNIISLAAPSTNKTVINENNVELASSADTENKTMDENGDHMKLTEILKLFDIAVEQLCTLMRTDSLIRFTNTKEYQTFYNLSADSIVKERSNSTKDAENGKLVLSRSVSASTSPKTTPHLWVSAPAIVASESS